MSVNMAANPAAPPRFQAPAGPRDGATRPEPGAETLKIWIPATERKKARRALDDNSPYPWLRRGFWKTTKPAMANDKKRKSAPSTEPDHEPSPSKRQRAQVAPEDAQLVKGKFADGLFEVLDGNREAYENSKP